MVGYICGWRIEACRLQSRRARRWRRVGFLEAAVAMSLQ